MAEQIPLMTPTKRVCLFTGGSGTLGQVFCQQYATEYHIVALYHQHLIPNALALESHVPSAADAPASIYSFAVNLMRFDLLQAMLTRVLQCFGQVDVLIHAATVLNQHTHWLAQGTLMPVPAIYHVNVIALRQLATLLTRRLWQTDAEQNHAANRNVIAVSSMSGIQMYPGGQEDYAAAKAALNLYAQHLNFNLQPLQMRANALCPGTFGRPNVPLTTETVAAKLREIDQGTMAGDVIPLVAAPASPPVP